MKWNEQQTQAIETCFADDGKRCNILVNAAAGSGKTAVLVERIIRKIENADGSDIDRLLVVTFTKAAAAEMQQKINRALVERMESSALDDTQKAHLMRQIRLLQSADICNIDSYCMRVVRNNFHILGVDPNFSPISGSELELMKDEAVDLLFEELYEKEGNEEFVRLAEMFSQTGNDRGLADIIKELYDFTTSLPEPEQWLEKAAEELADISVDSVYSDIKDEIMHINNDILYTAAKNVADMCADADGTEKCADTVDKAQVQASELIKKYEPEEDNPVNRRWGSAWCAAVGDFNIVLPLYGSDWKEAGKLADEFKFPSFPTDISKIKFKWGGKMQKENVDAADNSDMFAAFREAHDYIKDCCSKIGEKMSASPEEDIRIIKEFTLKDTQGLCRLTMQFSKKLETLKQRRGVLEFCDIERLVYKLMRDNPDIRKEYNEKYDEVLIDEYQDVNALQDAIFETISSGDNLFMVGDMKQSIYRFRNSDPTIFKHKTDTYHDEHNRVINLNKNYRSRENVLESINNVFSKIMSEGAGEIDYDFTQRLNAGDLAYEDVNNAGVTDNRSELVLVRRDENSVMSSAEAEAEYVAARIKDMIDSGFKVRRTVTDENGEQRFVYETARPRDFVILADSVKNIAEIYNDALERAGIVCYAETEGYFDRSEIMAVMSLIKMIDNPLNDVPFTASMRLPVCGFSDDELASVRLAGGDDMYSCAVNMSKSETELGKKCAAFLEKLEKWRSCAKVIPCDRLIWMIYEDTDLYAYYGSAERGEEAQANLRMLFERAREYESTGYKGIFNFIRFVDKMRERSSDFSPAKLISEEHDVVRIMTMHKSKGLEFPIVFIVGASKKFRLESGHTMCYHKDEGIGIRYINSDTRCSIPTAVTKRIDRKNKTETIAERMRLLYVAMTRAKEKLIITAPWKMGMQELNFSYEDNSRIVNSAKSFFEWLAPIAKTDKLWKYSEIIAEDTNNTESAKRVYSLEIPDKSGVIDWKYEHIDGTLSPAKISVTELKRRKMHDDIADSGQLFKSASVRKKPSFMTKEQPIVGAQKGTVVHYVMQTLPAFADMNVIKEHIAQLVSTGQLTKREAECVDCEKVLAFYSTDIAKRIQKSPAVYREVPFEIIEDSADVYGFSGEEVMLQGIIDCCFEEDGEFVLLDYKTDYYEKGKGYELAERYRFQIEKYGQAIEKITGKRVKEKYLYLFNHNDVEKIEN